GLGFCGYTTGGLGSAGYDDIAIDPSGNIWIASLDSNSMTEFVGLARPTRTPLIGPPVMP
ncbi:MAG: hypothetical protein ACRETD_09300, partial [Steroidobacteraceae bacterium]